MKCDKGWIQTYLACKWYVQGTLAHSVNCIFKEVTTTQWAERQREDKMHGRMMPSHYFISSLALVHCLRLDCVTKRAYACLYRGMWHTRRADPAVSIDYHQKEGTGRLECEFSVQKEKAYLHISVLLDPALFHPVPLCRLPPLLSP